MQKQNYKKQISLLIANSLIDKSSDFKNENNHEITQNEYTPYKGINTTEYFLNKEQILAIKAMFEQSSKDGRDEIVNELISYLNQFSINDITVSLKTLAFLGQADLLIENCFFSLKSEDKKQYEYLFNTISFLIAYKHQLFSYKQLNEIYDWIEEYFTFKNEAGKDRFQNRYTHTKRFDESLKAIKSQINTLLSRKVIAEIYSSFNPEVNQDEKILIEEFSRYGFPKDLTETLNKIDSNITNAHDGFDYKSCMDLMRAFTERLFQSIAIEIDHKNGRDLDVKDSEKVAKFYISNGLLSSNQASFLSSMRHFLSNQGSHKLKSPPEECRLSRNILIEFSLFLFGRLKQLKNKE
ncbi:hypothetical protein KKI22_01880 [Patescibacteria group bacterium]|nr:hypothetical protein [Patescibacteria group bacterium]